MNKALIANQEELRARRLFLEGESPIKALSGTQRRLHVIAVGDSGMMRAAVRQAVLLAHFPNFNDDTGDNRTLVSWKSDRPKQLFVDLQSGTGDSDFGRLLQYCRVTVDDGGKDDLSFEHMLQRAQRRHVTACDGGKRCVFNDRSFIDVEFHFVPTGVEVDKGTDEQVLEIITNERGVLQLKNGELTKDDDSGFQELKQPDMTRAMYINTVYEVAQSYFDEISPMHRTIVHDIEKPINIICKHLTDRRRGKIWGKLEKDYEMEGAENAKKSWKAKINMLSSLYCADNFELRVETITGPEKKENPKDEAKKNCPKDKEEKICLKDEVKKNCLNIARTEHCRWNVEKLVMGFRPFNEEELYKDSLQPGHGKREEYRSQRKSDMKDPSHIDLCTNYDIRRRSPQSFKYDAFLMLAMPSILKATKKKKNTQEQ